MTMDIFGSGLWSSSPFSARRPGLGQMPLVLGPSSWGAAVPFAAAGPPAVAAEVPPYWGQWGVVEEGGVIKDSGEVGPYNTIEEAFDAAVAAAGEHGATALPGDGWAQVRDSQGKPVGPVT